MFVNDTRIINCFIDTCCLNFGVTQHNKLTLAFVRKSAQKYYCFNNLFLLNVIATQLIVDNFELLWLSKNNIEVIVF